MTKNKKLLIIGVHLKSEGYPNVKYRVSALKRTYPHCEEFNFSMWDESGLGKQGRYSILKSGGRMLWAHLLVMFKFVSSGKKEVVYVPYPSVFISFIASFLPRAVRPKKLVIDAFISIYDTVVCDRKMLSEKGLLAKILRKVEKRAFEMADVIVTDTPLNSKYYAQLFDIDNTKFLAIPLSTNETDYYYTPYIARTDSVCRVLFIGTFIPLHGIGTIVDAISLLSKDRGIFFTLIGDGEEAYQLNQLLDSGLENFEWISEWQSPESISKYIRASDICLGIFGNTEKASRVCPYKIYSYSLCGRPVITAYSDWMKTCGAWNTFQFVSSGDHVQLAREIICLANNAEERVVLSEKSHDFYERTLSNFEAARCFYDCLFDLD